MVRGCMLRLGFTIIEVFGACNLDTVVKAYDDLT